MLAPAEFREILAGWERLERSTVARRVSALRALLRFARGKGWISGDRAAGYRAPRYKRKLPRFLEISEMRALIECVTPDIGWGLRDRTLLEVLYGAGLRVSEACRLRWGETAAENEHLAATTANLARLTGEDMTQAAAGAADVFQRWNVATGDQSATLDMFLVASQESGKSVSELESAVSTAAATMGPFGYSLKETTDVMAAAAKTGSDLTVVTGGLNKMMVKLEGAQAAEAQTAKAAARADEQQAAAKLARSKPTTTDDVRNRQDTDARSVNHVSALGKPKFNRCKDTQTHEEAAEKNEIHYVRKDGNGGIAAKKFQHEHGNRRQHDAHKRFRSGAFCVFADDEEKKRQHKIKYRVVELHGMNGNRVPTVQRIEYHAKDRIRRLTVGLRRHQVAEPFERKAKRCRGQQDIEPLQKRRALIPRDEKEHDTDADASSKETESPVPYDKNSHRILHVHLIYRDNRKQSSGDSERNQVQKSVVAQVIEIEVRGKRETKEELRGTPPSNEQEDHVHPHDEMAVEERKCFKHNAENHTGFRVLLLAPRRR
jgi:hypothetical protein